jgi:hypothetical protein
LPAFRTNWRIIKHFIFSRSTDVLIGSAVGPSRFERRAGHKLKPLDCLGTNRSEVLLQQMAGR